MSATTNQPTSTELVEALRLAGGQLDDGQRKVALATYRLLAGGDPVMNEAIAEEVGMAEEAVARYFEEWPAVFRNSDDAVVGFWGLALQPLEPEYSLVATDTGRHLGYAWCAWDTLFLPTLLGQTIDVTSTDGQTGEPIVLTVAPDGIQAIEPAETLVSFLSPNAPWESDILATFCHKVLFFANQVNADAWIASHPDELFTVTVDEAFDIGRRWTADRYGDTLD